MSIEDFEAVVKGEEFVISVLEKQKEHGVEKVMIRYSTWFAEASELGVQDKFKASINSQSYSRDSDYVEVSDILLFNEVVKATGSGYYLFPSDKECLVCIKIQNNCNKHQTSTHVVSKSYVDR